jgi:hypothetical protein
MSRNGWNRFRSGESSERMKSAPKG